jgi:hypothetical protein
MQHPERQKLGQTAFLLDIKVLKNLLSFGRVMSIDHRTCRAANAPGSVGAWKRLVVLDLSKSPVEAALAAPHLLQSLPHLLPPAHVRLLKSVSFQDKNKKLT